MSQLKESKIKMSNFKKELEQLINSHSLENDNNTPDFILAEYLTGCLKVFNKTIEKREKWYGRETENVTWIKNSNMWWW